MTIGTSINRSSFTLTVPHSAPQNRWLHLRGGSKTSVLRGLAIQKVDGFLVADSCPDSIEATIACQTCAHRFGCLFCLFSQRLHFLIHFLVADLNFLFVSHLFKQQRSFQILNSLVPLSSAQALKIHFFHLFGGKTLRRQCPQSALQTDINLALD